MCFVLSPRHATTRDYWSYILIPHVLTAVLKAFGFGSVSAADGLGTLRKTYQRIISDVG